MANGSTSPHKDARFWLAVAITIAFAVLTWSAYAKANGFTEAFQIWDNLAVIYSGLVGGLLGFTVNQMRASQAENRAQRKQQEADEARKGWSSAENRVRVMLPLVERVADLTGRHGTDDVQPGGAEAKLRGLGTEASTILRDLKAEAAR